jgi:hypothetical protein
VWKKSEIKMREDTEKRGWRVGEEKQNKKRLGVVGRLLFAAFAGSR